MEEERCTYAMAMGECGIVQCELAAGHGENHRGEYTMRGELFWADGPRYAFRMNALVAQRDQDNRSRLLFRFWQWLSRVKEWA